MAHTFNLPMVSPSRIAAPSLPFANPMCNAVKMTASGRSMSAQALAARTRRKRISEKFRELGELIPGGSRLATADMLAAGFKYVSFMQAQIGVLGVMRSVQVQKIFPNLKTFEVLRSGFIHLCVFFRAGMCRESRIK